ncbi:MAG: SlyX family protein [Planctomycetota bacterium]
MTEELRQIEERAGKAIEAMTEQTRKLTRKLSDLQRNAGMPEHREPENTNPKDFQDPMDPRITQLEEKVSFLENAVEKLNSTAEELNRQLLNMQREVSNLRLEIGTDDERTTEEEGPKPTY